MRLSALALAGVVTGFLACPAVASQTVGGIETQGYYQLGQNRIEVTATDDAGEKTGSMVGEILKGKNPNFDAKFGGNCILNFAPSILGLLMVTDISTGSGSCQITPLPTALRVKQ